MNLSISTKFAVMFLPLAAFAALIVWLVYSIKYGEEARKTSKSIKNNAGGEAMYDAQRAEIAFQAVVATLLFYLVIIYSLQKM